MLDYNEAQIARVQEIIDLIGINNDVFSMKLFDFSKFDEAIKKWDDAEETLALVWF